VEVTGFSRAPSGYLTPPLKGFLWNCIKPEKSTVVGQAGGMLDLIRVISVSVDSGCVAYAVSQCAGHRFYRATLCVSAVFAIAGCPSVTLMFVSRRLKISLNFFTGPVAPSFAFFDPKCWYPIPRGTPSVGCKIHGGGKILRFSTEVAVYLGNGTR